jgi:hypothetical protein
MRVHPGRATVAAVALAEVGSVAGACVCWLFFTGWAVLSYGYGTLGRNDLLGITVWALLVGVPVGALATPLLAFSLMRRTAIWRALVFPGAGALLGLAIGVRISAGLAMLPVPPLAVALATSGVVAGSLAARVEWRGALASLRRRLRPWRRPTLR